MTQESKNRYEERLDLIEKSRLSTNQKEKLNAYATARYQLDQIQSSISVIGFENFRQNTFDKHMQNQLPDLANNLNEAKDSIIRTGGTWHKTLLGGHLTRESDGATQYGETISLPEDTRRLIERL